MQEIFSNTTLTVNQLIEKLDTGELGLPELQRLLSGRIQRFVTFLIP